MVKRKKAFIRFTAVIAAIMCLIGCGEGESGAAKEEFVKQSPAKEQVDMTTLNEKEKLYYGADENLHENALVEEGDNARIAALMKKAEEGGKYKIAVLGGSISQGTGSSDQAHCYGSIVCDWWITNFPNSNFEFINAGIGSTNAEMACYRIEKDLLQYEPDFVVVDFTVNTYLNRDVKGTHSTLFYKILSQSNSPAVMSIDYSACVHTKYSKGECVKTTDVPNADIAATVKDYQIPAVSYHNYVWRKIEEGVFGWNDIAADYIHPNDNGHQLGASIIISHLEYVKEQLDDISTEITEPSKPSGEKYLNLSYVNNSAEGVQISGGFFKQDGSNAANRGWSYKADGSAAQLTIPLPANRSVSLLMMFDEGSSGMVTVTGANGMTSNVMPDKAASPTLVKVSSMGTSITISPSMSSGGFKIYGICIEE